MKLPEDPGELHFKRLDHSQKVIHDREEYNAYMAALKLPDPRQKAAAMEEFATRYPHSASMRDALAQAMAAYQVSSNTAKVAEMATRLLQLQFDLRPLSIIVFLARDCATKGTTIYTQSIGKQLLQLSQRGLAALPEWQETRGASLPEGTKLRDQMAAIFAGAAGWGALQNRDYTAARQFYEKALAIDPKNRHDLYQLAVVDLEMTPIDLNGFWYCGKALSIAQLQQNSAVVMMSPYCKFKFKQHGGKPEEWDQLVSNTEKDMAPPQDFLKSLSLQNLNSALQKLDQTLQGAAPPPSEQEYPLSKLIIPVSNERATGVGAGSGVGVVMTPAEHPDARSESLSSSEFSSRYGWYVQDVRMTVAAAWHVPTDNNATDHPVLISFEIQPDGSPSNLRMEQSSGVALLDEAAMQAVRGIDKFGPPPTHEKIIVKFVFDSRDKK